MPIAIVAERDPHAVRRILGELPDWFGDPAAIDNYAADAADEGFNSLLAREGDDTVGIALVARHFPQSAELHLIAVSPAARGRGIGRALTERACIDLASDSCLVLTVHTVGPSFNHDGYARRAASMVLSALYPWRSTAAWTGPVPP